MTASYQIDFRKSFVVGLELPPTPTSPGFRGPGQEVAPQDKQAGNYVNAGSVVSFVSGVSAQNQADILHTTLLAQLAADKKYDREKDTVGWYKFYRSVLEHVGWVLQDFDFTEYDGGGKTFTMDKAVLDILAAIAVQNELLAIKAAIDAAKSLADRNDGRIALFDRATSHGTKGAFQIGIAGETNNVAAMKMGAFYFGTKSAVTKILWFTFSSKEASLYGSSQSLTFDPRIYANIRSDVEQKLGDRTRQFLASLDF